MSADLGGLGRVLDKLSRVASNVAPIASPMLADLIAEEFAGGADPYGTPWQTLSETSLALGRTDPPLSDTDAMRDSVKVFPMQGAGIAITIDAPAVHHQFGAPNNRWGPLPARPILPNHGIPPTWARALADAKDEAWERAQR